MTRTLALAASWIAMLATVGSTVVAADVIVTASIEPRAVQLREAATLVVSVQGSQTSSRPTVPDVPGLRIQYAGPSSQVSIVNGRISASVSHRLLVSAANPGRYEIGPIQVEVAGKRHDAGSVSFEVLATGAPAPTEPTRAVEDLTLEVTAANTDVYLHERVPLTVTLRIRDVRVDDLQYPDIPGEGLALGTFSEPRQRRERGPGGSLEHVIEFHTTVTPLKQGDLTVGPVGMRMSRAVPSRRPGLFGGGFFGDQLRPAQVFAEPITLRVSPLPEEGRPADFSGAVGRFTLETVISPREVVVGDPITVTSVVRGDGALDGIHPPAISGDDSLRTYPVQTGRTGDDGARTFEQVVIPARAGERSLAGPAFSYFDPEARQYRTLAGGVVDIRVTPSDRATDEPRIFGAQPAAQPAPREQLGRDLVFIKDAPGALRPIGTRLYHSPSFWIAQLAAPLLLFGVIFYDRRRTRIAGDTRFARFTRAGKVARTGLERARAAFDRGDLAGAHDTSAAAIRDYLAAKLDIAPGAVAELAPQRLRATKVDDALVDDVASFLAACEHARFAPNATSAHDIEAAIATAQRIVTALEAARRLRSVFAAGLLAVATLSTLIAASTPAIGAADATPESLAAGFFRGNALYGDERYDEAAAAYEKTLASGVESGPLYFNLGNAHFKAGDLGKAILAYERATRLMPGDADLVANLAYARELSGDEPLDARLTRLLFALAERWSSDALAASSAICWWIALGLLSVARLAPRFAVPARRMAAIAAVALVVVASSFVQRLRTVELPRFAVVTSAADAIVRYQPSTTGTAFFAAKPGTVVEVESSREGWSRVRSRDGRRGWIETETISRL